MAVESLAGLDRRGTQAGVKDLRPGVLRAVRKERLDPAPYGTLGGLARAWALYLPGLLYLRGCWADDRWGDLVAADGRPLPLRWVRWPQPLVALPPAAGGDRGWDHALFAFPWEYAKDVDDLICGTAQTGTTASGRRGWLYGVQAVSLPDATAGGVLIPGAPPVDVGAVAVRSDRHTHLYLGHPPAYRQGPADWEPGAVARAFAGGDNPLAVVARDGYTRGAERWQRTGRLPAGW